MKKWGARPALDGDLKPCVVCNQLIRKGLRNCPICRKAQPGGHVVLERDPGRGQEPSVGSLVVWTVEREEAFKGIVDRWLRCHGSLPKEFSEEPRVQINATRFECPPYVKESSNEFYDALEETFLWGEGGVFRVGGPLPPHHIAVRRLHHPECETGGTGTSFLGKDAFRTIFLFLSWQQLMTVRCVSRQWRFNAESALGTHLQFPWDRACALGPVPSTTSEMLSYVASVVGIVLMYRRTRNLSMLLSKTWDRYDWVRRFVLSQGSDLSERTRELEKAMSKLRSIAEDLDNETRTRYHSLVEELFATKERVKILRGLQDSLCLIVSELHKRLNFRLIRGPFHGRPRFGDNAVKCKEAINEAFPSINKDILPYYSDVVAKRVPVQATTYSFPQWLHQVQHIASVLRACEARAQENLKLLTEAYQDLDHTRSARLPKLRMRIGELNCAALAGISAWETVIWPEINALKLEHCTAFDLWNTHVSDTKYWISRGQEISESKCNTDETRLLYTKFLELVSQFEGLAEPPRPQPELKMQSPKIENASSSPLFEVCETRVAFTDICFPNWPEGVDGPVNPLQDASGFRVLRPLLLKEEEMMD